MTTATETQPQTRSVCILTGADHESAQDCSTHRHRIESVPATTETPTITLFNFRVVYRAPRYEDGRVLYDGYCAILADDAALDGAEVRVFDVPDVDEGQLAAAMFACEAMNQYERVGHCRERYLALYGKH